MTDEIQVVRPAHVRNRTYHLAGLGLMAANFVRHRIAGYRTPRQPSVRGLEPTYQYDKAVVEGWLHHLGRHIGEAPDLEGKVALEIGPGPDLGTGLMLLARGATGYKAMDIHPLVDRAHPELHKELVQRMATEMGANEGELLAQLDALHRGEPDRLHYKCKRPLDLSLFGEQSVDLVLSHAVFEHIDRVERTFEQLAKVVRPGARLVAEIDLQTHTRWIRDADPLNIYRYQDHVYQAFSFSGSPNRVRPDHYVNLLLKLGWCNPRLYPRRVLDPAYVKQVESSMASRFRHDPEQLGWLSVVLCATWKPRKRP